MSERRPLSSKIEGCTRPRHQVAIRDRYYRPLLSQIYYANQSLSLISSLFLRQVSFAAHLPFLESLLTHTFLLEYPYIKAFDTRVLSPRGPLSMVLEVNMLARTIFDMLMMHFIDTSSADCTLRSQAMIASGLMTRNSLLIAEFRLLGEHCGPFIRR